MEMEEKVKEIISVVAKYYGLEPQDVLGKCRKGKLSNARSMAIFVLRMELGTHIDKLANIFTMTMRCVFWHINKMSRYTEMYNDVKSDYLYILDELRREGN